MENIIEKFKINVAFFAKMKEEFVKKMGEELKPIFVELMSKLPETIQTIGFAAYTPYFNDGDECTFGVYTGSPDDVFINGTGNYNLDDKDNILSETLYEKDSSGEYKKIPNPIFNKSLYDSINDIIEVIEATPEEIWSFMGQGLFQIHRDGSVTVEHYDHD